jgi:phosphomannomutase
VGDSLTPTLVASFAQAFGSYVGRGQVVVGRDTRTSGMMVREAVVSGLLSVGCQPVDIGICPIPTALVRTRHSGAVGAIIITASHNPIEWNALKFIGRDGLFLNSSQAEELLDIYHQEQFSLVGHNDFKLPLNDPDPAKKHLELIRDNFNYDLVRKAKIKVAYDCCNGAGAVLTPKFMELFGCETFPINISPDGIFPHNPEPVPENLKQLCDAVKKNGADVGFVQDADADRLAIVDEQGRPIGEDMSLALAAKQILSLHKGPVVINITTSRSVEDIARSYDCPVIYTKVGEINVVEQLIASNAVIGGEGSAGVMLPKIHPCRDSYSAMATILELMAATGKRISRLVDQLPRYKILKEKFPCSTENAHRIIRELKRRCASEGVIRDIDGIRIDYRDGWVAVRPSNTEAIMRLVAEAQTESEAKELIDRFMGICSEIANDR